MRLWWWFGEGRDYLSLMPLTLLAQVHANLFDGEGDEIIPRARHP
jgi:hypothetical protein